MRFKNDTRSVRRVGQRVIVRMRRTSMFDEGDPVRGTVIALDLPGQPPGVEVRFDRPINGLLTCYATYDEVRAR